MRFKRITFNLLSIMVGFHYGRNPVTGQRFLHVAPIPFVGFDFEFRPYVIVACAPLLTFEDSDIERLRAGRTRLPN
jgi:hypothetical protein